MSKVELWSIAETLNSQLEGTELAHFHETRRVLKGNDRRAATTLFSYQGLHDGYILHYGGRGELQFNIGWDVDSHGEKAIRFGVAFSFDKSRWVLDTSETLIPKLRLFNDYMAKEQDRFADLAMWHYEAGERSANRMPAPISDDVLNKAGFVFMGITQPPGDIDYQFAVSVFLRLYSIYLYIETHGKRDAVHPPAHFTFKPGNRNKLSNTAGVRNAGEFSVSLRHNDLQQRLTDELEEEYGEGSVGTENKAVAGGFIDLVVSLGERKGLPQSTTFYEIKTAATAKDCIRQAIGQLLEYSYYNSEGCAGELVVAGEPELQEEDKLYLERLRNQLNIPISYRRIRLGPQQQW